MLLPLLALLACTPLEAPDQGCAWVQSDDPVDTELFAQVLPGGTRSLALPARFVGGEPATLEGAVVVLGEPYSVRPEGQCAQQDPQLAVPVVLDAEERRSGTELQGAGELRVDPAETLSLRVVVPTPLDSASPEPSIARSGIAVLDIGSGSFALQTCVRGPVEAECTPWITPSQPASR